MSVLRNIAIQNDKKNKTRSILIIIAIVLTTLLLTVIASSCYGMIKNNKEQAGNYYGAYHGMYGNVTESQIEEMELRSEFLKIGRMAYAGEVQSDQDISFYWIDDKVETMINLDQSLEEGHMPTKENEIAANKSFFKKLGIENPKIGDNVLLESRIDNKSKFSKKTFVISGFIKEIETGITQKSYMAYVSQDFYNEQVKEENRLYNAYFLLGEEVKLNSENAKTLIQDLAEKCGIDKKQATDNRYYIMWSTDPGIETIVGGIFLICCVVFFSVVVIYNIFQVGIVQKIQEYGKIKALGATKKQLKKIVLMEGMFLALIAIPIGLLLGCLVGSAVFSWIVEQGNTINPTLGTLDKNIISIPILIGAAIIAVLTVRIALEKPMRMVAKISSVEAMRFQGNYSKKQSIRKGHKQVNVKTMTMANLSMNKRRTIGTIMTMGLSCVLFVVMANYLGNMDMERDARGAVEYGQFVIELNYSLNDEAYPENNLDSILKEDPLGNEIVEQIKQIEGVTEVRTRKQIVLKKTNPKESSPFGMSSVAVLNREDFDKAKENGTIVGNLDYEKASKENGLIYGMSYFMEDYGYSIGQTLDVTLENGASSSDYKGIIQGAFGRAQGTWIITEDTYEQLGLKEGGNGWIWVDCKEEDSNTVKTELEAILSSKEHVEIGTYEDALKTSRISFGVMRLICYSFVCIIGFIGFMNLANTMIINIITRKQEIGMLQAIGMTNRQVNRMLQMEGIVFTLGTVLVSILIGVPAGYGIFQYGKGHGWTGLYQYHFPWAELLGMIIVVGALQIVLSFILSRNIRKESVMNRIRY